MSKEDSLVAAKASTTFVEGGNLTFLDKEASLIVVNHHSQPSFNSIYENST